MIGRPVTGANRASAATPANPAPTANLRRRLISLIYEALILIAVLFVGALPAVMFTHAWEPATARAALQAWLLLLCATFYTWQWVKRGQTLPMKTWKLRLIAADGAPVSVQRALCRYIVAGLSLSTLGLGFLWAMVDRDKQFLHDRLAGTRIVATPE